MRSTWVLAVLYVALLTSGCGDPFIDPYVNTGRYFTVWGYLDPTAEEQTVRVVPVSRVSPAIESSGDEQADIDARVFLTHIGSDRTVEMRYTLTELADGSFGHVFRTNLRIQQGGHYRLEVHRSDGVIASADTWVPSFNSTTWVEVSEPWLDAENHVRQRATLHNIPSPWAIRVEYLAEGGLWKRLEWIDYGRTGEQTADGGWTFEIDLTEDHPAVRANVDEGIRNGEVGGELGFDQPFGLTRMGVRVLVTDTDWDIPEGPLDPDYYSRPDVLTNIQNGYGYWGAVNGYTEQWGISRELSQSLGWPL